jgi:hypothetical protein
MQIRESFGKEQLGGTGVLEARDMLLRSCHSIRPEVRHHLGDSASERHERNHQGKRAAAAKEHGTLRANLVG